jgi:DNA-binding NarL/FixJ family response regulator
LGYIFYRSFAALAADFVERPTPRELEIVRLLIKGYCNKEIARQLDISVHTVEFHLKHVYQKLGASGRGDVTLKAIKAGWLAIDGLHEQGEG